MAAARACVVGNDGVVVHLGHRSSPLTVEAEIGEPADHDGLKVGHEVPPDERMLEPRQQQQTRGLDGPTGHHHVTGIHGMLDAVRTDEVHSGRPFAIGADPGHERLRAQFGVAAQQCLLQHGHRVALGVDGTAEVRAEPTVVARRSTIVRLGIGGPGGRVGVEPERNGCGRRQLRTVHGRSRRHRVRTRSPCGEGVGPCLPRHTDPTAPRRRRTARARRSRGASRRPRRHLGDRRWTAGRSPLPGSAGPCRRHGCLRPRPSSGWS